MEPSEMGGDAGVRRGVDLTESDAVDEWPLSGAG
jgi:hypothetical protein